MLTTLTTAQIAAVYNMLAAKPVTKFENKAVAVKRVSELLDGLSLTFDASPQAAANAEVTVDYRGAVIGYLISTVVEEIDEDAEDGFDASTISRIFSLRDAPAASATRRFTFSFEYINQYDETGKMPRGFHQYFAWIARDLVGYEGRTLGYESLDYYRAHVMPVLYDRAVEELEA